MSQIRNSAHRHFLFGGRVPVSLKAPLLCTTLATQELRPVWRGGEISAAQDRMSFASHPAEESAAATKIFVRAQIQPLKVLQFREVNFG